MEIFLAWAVGNLECIARLSATFVLNHRSSQRVSITALSVRDYPVSAEEYELLEEAGRGVSATVSALQYEGFCVGYAAASDK